MTPRDRDWSSWCAEQDKLCRHVEMSPCDVQRLRCRDCSAAPLYELSPYGLSKAHNQYLYYCPNCTGKRVWITLLKVSHDKTS